MKEFDMLTDWFKPYVIKLGIKESEENLEILKELIEKIGQQFGLTIIQLVKDEFEITDKDIKEKK